VGHGISVKFVCERFINFQEGRKILTLLTFGYPTDNKYLRYK